MTDPVPARGSLRSRGAALVSMLTLRQISAVLPPEQAWGLWVSRQIVAGVMDVFGDARRLAADIRAGGGRCELQVWPDQVHVFQALPRLSPEAAKAMALVARFIDTSLRARGFDAAAGKAG
jgi:acetyl esterase/lipase